MRRAGMALASMQGRSVPEIAVMFAAKQETVRELINTFNDRGFSALDPKARRGSMPRIGPMVREQICRTAKSDPARLGCPFTCWSLTKLRDYLAENKHIRVSHETIRQVLRKAGISFQNTKTWKHSSDPQFAAKKQRILALYDSSPADGTRRGNLRGRSFHLRSPEGCVLLQVPSRRFDRPLAYGPMD